MSARIFQYVAPFLFRVWYWLVIVEEQVGYNDDALTGSKGDIPQDQKFSASG